MASESFTSIVVDDDRQTRRVVAQALSSAGHSVTTAEDAEEAIVLLRDRPADLVVTDWDMPGMDGIELAGELRALPDGGPGVILISGAGADVGSAALEAGCDDFLMKPVNLEELGLRAARVIGERRRERDLVRERRRTDRERSARRDAENVTEQTMSRLRNLLAEQRELGALHESLLASAGSGIFGVDLDGRATFVNDAACATLGFEREELIGAVVHPLTHHTRADGRPYPEQDCPIVAAARTGEASHVPEGLFFAKGGERREVAYTATPIRVEGRITGAVVVFSDISERNRSAERIRAQNDQLRAQSEELEAQNEQMSDQQEELEAQNEQLQEQQVRLEQRTEQLVEQRGELQGLYERAAAENQRLEGLYAAARSLATGQESGDLAEATLGRLSEAAGSQVAALYLRREGDAAVPLVASIGIQGNELPELLQPGHGLAGRALAEATALRADHSESELRLMVFGEPVALRRELHVPLQVRSEVVGVASFGWSDETALDDELQPMLEALCAQAAAGLARAASERATYEREAVIRTVLDATPDIIMLFDPDGRVSVANAAARSFYRGFGIEATGISGEVLTGQLAERTTDPEAFRAGAAVTDRRVVNEFTLSESARSFRRYMAPVRDEAGESLGRIVVAREVTEERRAERMKDEIVATVSHELRTPLTSILGYTELLDEELGARLGDDERQMLQVVERNARRLLNLVGDLLVAAQAEARELDIVEQDCDMVAIAAACVEDARPSARERSIDLTLDAPRPAVLRGDADRLGQAMANLVGNALKFTPEGGAVSVRVRIDDGSARIEVEDTGPGIEEHEVERLFERFFRGESAAAVETPGSGLGLSVTRAVVVAHGGEVSVDTELGRGTTMIVSLPLKDSQSTQGDEQG